MSLINKMLQDLEGRRLDGEVVGSMHGQVRAAPEPARIHVAWWIALGLAFILTGLVSWLWGYQTAPTTITVQQPQLSLKLAPSIETMPPPVPPKSVAEEERSGTAKEESASAIVQPPDAPSRPAAEADAPSHAADATVVKPSASPAAGAVTARPTEPRPAKPAPDSAGAAVALPATTPAAVARPSAQRPSAGMEKPSPVSVAGNVHERSTSRLEKQTAFDIPANVSKQIKELTPSQKAEEEFRRATVLLDQGKNNESIAALDKALQFDPQHSVARQTLAGVLLEARRQDDAIRTLQSGLALDKNQPGMAMMLARVQVDRGDLRPAIETLQRTLSYAAGRADFQAFLAALLQRDGRHKEAVEHYLIALRKTPSNGLWWMGIGISLHADNRAAEARDAFVRARASNSLSPELLAFVEQKLNQLQ